MYIICISKMNQDITRQVFSLDKPQMQYATLSVLGTQKVFFVSFVTGSQLDSHIAGITESEHKTSNTPVFVELEVLTREYWGKLKSGIDKRFGSGNRSYRSELFT